MPNPRLLTAEYLDIEGSDDTDRHLVLEFKSVIQGTVIRLRPADTAASMIVQFQHEPDLAADCTDVALKHIPQA